MGDELGHATCIDRLPVSLALLSVPILNDYFLFLELAYEFSVEIYAKSWHTNLVSKSRQKNNNFEISRISATDRVGFSNCLDLQYVCTIIPGTLMRYVSRVFVRTVLMIITAIVQYEVVNIIAHFPDIAGDTY